MIMPRKVAEVPIVSSVSMSRAALKLRKGPRYQQRVGKRDGDELFDCFCCLRTFDLEEGRGFQAEVFGNFVKWRVGSTLVDGRFEIFRCSFKVVFLRSAKVKQRIRSMKLKQGV